MEGLVKKEEQLIFEPIEQLIYRLLLDGFKNRKGYLVNKVERISFANLQCDTEKSEFKQNIFIDRILFKVRVWVVFSEESTTNDDLSLSFNRQIQLSYNFEDKAYQIDNEEELSLLDKSPY